MRPDGIEILSRWREVGAWWEGEPELEVVRYRDPRGINRERSRILSTTLAKEVATPYNDDHREDISLRPRKLRDEKVSLANGYGEVPLVPFVHAPLPAYAPLHVHSGYSFGRSLLFARELPRRAANLGIPAMAITDRFSLSGAVEFVRECHDHGIKPIVGAVIEHAEGGEIVLLARDKLGYTELSRLITACHLEEPRLYPMATWERIERHSRGLLCLTGGDTGRLNRLLLSGDHAEASRYLDRLKGTYGRQNVVIEIERSWLPWDRQVNHQLLTIADREGLLACAGGAVTHARKEDFPAQDVLVCADTLCLVDELIGRKPTRDDLQPKLPDRPSRALNRERYLHSLDDIHEKYRDHPELLANTLRIVEMCDENVLPSRTRLPKLTANSNQTFHEAVLAGAQAKHKTITPALRRRLEMEMERIVRLSFADHFLVMWDACRWAKEQDILHSGRGSVVDSAVAYCLGLSRIDAFHHHLHFDRFLPDDSTKRPDIDIDFEAKRRDDIRNYFVQKYGKDRVATVAAFGAYCTRGIVREVGKALGMPNEAIGFLAKRIHGGVPPDQLEDALNKRPELRDSNISRDRLQWLFQLSKQLLDVPRNLRAHSSGVVISDQPLCDTVPITWSAGTQFDGESETNLRLIQWDKRSAKHYFDKFDILCLRGQDVLGGTQQRMRQRELDFDVEQISLEDEETYRTMRSGELIGVPQSASPAMRQAHIRIQTSDLTDASLVQAGIRPGVGGAVKMNELIARRRGTSPYSFEHPDLEDILGHTYGIVVFQEQIDQLLQVFAGYGSGEAEDIRDEIHKRRREDYGQTIKSEVIDRIIAKGYPPELADHVFQLVAGFKGYGFAQGHALAFAEISVRSIFCQQNYPAEYFASLLDAQPAGYYGPCTLVNEARTRGVTILPVCVNRSECQFTVEDVKAEDDPQIVVPYSGIRVGFNQIAAMSKSRRQRIIRERKSGYESFFDFARKVNPNRDELEQLILCGAFDALHPNRRALLWAIPAALHYARESAENGLALDPPTITSDLADFTVAERAIRERKVLDLDVKEHLMTYERETVNAKGGITTRDAQSLSHRQRAIVVGNPIRLRFPPTPSGKRVVFFDLEDETGLLNVTSFDDCYQRDGHALVCSNYVTVIGHAQWRDGHMAFLASRIFPYSPRISRQTDIAELPIVKSDFLVG